MRSSPVRSFQFKLAKLYDHILMFFPPLRSQTLREDIKALIMGHISFVFQQDPTSMMHMWALPDSPSGLHPVFLT